MAIRARRLSTSTRCSSITLRDGVAGAGAANGIGTLTGSLEAPSRASLRPWLREHALGLLALAVIAGCSLLLVIIAADRPSIVSSSTRADFFPGWMAGPLGGLWPSLTRSETALKIVFTAIIAAMYACYALGMRRISALGARWVIGAILAVQLIFFLSPPLTLTDVFNYINYARMDVVHNLNPYATIPALEPHSDPTFALSNWHDLLSPYGPLFTILAFSVALLPVAVSFWVAKGAIALLTLAMLALVWRCARLLDRDPVQAVVFVGLNPIVLIWGLGGDHNDIFMVFFVVLACWLLLRSKDRQHSWLMPRSINEFAAGASLAAAVFVKASGAIVVPVFLAALLKTPRRAVQTLLGLLIGCLLLAGLSYAVFGPHVPSDVTQGSLVTGLSPPNLLGLALGLGGESEALRKVLELVLIATVIACCLLAWRRRDFITPSGWATLALLVTLAWVLPWYILWALPLVALSDSRRLRVTMIAFSIYLALAWLPTIGAITKGIGLRPETTSLAHQHQRVIRELIN